MADRIPPPGATTLTVGKELDLELDGGNEEAEEEFVDDAQVQGSGNVKKKAAAGGWGRLRKMKNTIGGAV